MATLTLYPKYITAGASFNGILSSNGTGEDYRSIPPSGLDVGTIGFDTSPLHNRSSACVLTEYKVSYRQRCNINQWSKLYWRLTPRKISLYSINGNSLTVNGYSSFGRRIDSDTTGDGWLDMGGPFIDSQNAGSYNKDGLFGGSAMLGFFLRGDNDHSIGDYKLYMGNLRASVTYTPRYIATFYDNENDMNVVGSMTLNANDSPSISTAESYYSRTGYQIAGWKCVAGDSNRIGNTYLYSLGTPIGSSIDTDVGWVPVWEPVKYRVAVYPLRTETAAGIYIEKYVNNAWEHQTPTSVNQSNYAYYQLDYGDRIRFVADGYRVDQNVVYSSWSSAGAGSGTLDGSSGWPIVVLEDSGLDREAYVRVQAVQDVVFAIETSKTGNGFITASRNAPRGSAALVAILPDTGWLLSTYTVDGVEHSATQYEQTNGKRVVWQSVDTQHTVSAVFVRQPIQITSTLPNGVTVKDGSGNTVTFPDTVYYGDNKTYVFSCANTKSLLTIDLDGYNMMDPVKKQVTSFQIALSNITETHAFGGTVTSDLVTISIQQNTGGTVSGDTGVYVKNTGTVPFSYALTDGYGFVKWFDNSTGRTVDVSTNTSSNSITVSATFEPKTIKIHSEATCEAVRYNGDNVIHYSFGGATVQIGDDDPGYTANKYISSEDTVAIKATPNPGFVFYRATIETTEVQGLTPDEDGAVTVTVATPTADKNVYFYFRRVIYDADIFASSEACSVSINKKGPNNTETQYHYGSELRLTATPGTGWYFRYWSDDNANQNAVRDIVIPANDVEISAVFKKYEFEQTVETHEGGKVTIGDSDAGTHNVEYGDELLLTITADYGRKIKDVLLDGVSVLGAVTLTRRGGTYLLYDITAPHNIEVFFETRIYTNNRKLLDYYPPVIKSIHEIRSLMEALQVQNDAMWDAVSFLFENQFIESATNEGVTMWERELGIIPAPTDTLQQRKERLRIKWVPKPRFTMRWLTGTEQEPGWLEKVCGQPVPDPVLTDYSLRVTLPGGVDWMTIFDDLKRYKPTNIVLDPRVLMPRGTKHIYVGTATMISNHDSPIKYTLTVEGE